MVSDQVSALGRDSIHYAATWRPGAGTLETLTNLKIIFSLGAGVDDLLRDHVLPNVPIVRCTHADLANRMSEWVILNALAHLRQFKRYECQQKLHQWIDDRTQPAARDVTVGVMGLGLLGRDAAVKLANVDFNVIGWSTTKKVLPGVMSFQGPGEFEVFLSMTDILVSLLPLTKETEGILNRATFTKLKKGGVLGGPIVMNAGRGRLQSDADILACLEENILRAATLDVFEREPLVDTSPLWDHPNVTITPHNAAMSNPAAIVNDVVGQIKAFERGEPLRNVVNRTRGY